MAAPAPNHTVIAPDAFTSIPSYNTRDVAGLLHLPQHSREGGEGDECMPRVRTMAAVSAGGVVARKVDGRIQVALVGDSQRGAWYLPKGGLDKGETIEQAALREVTEETGLKVKIVRPIRAIEYWFFVRGGRVHKKVHYFLMEPTGGDFSLRDEENDRAGWFDLDEALAIMSYANEAEVVREGVAALQCEPHPTKETRSTASDTSS
ncbi:MAG: NUDIX hydrolase [Sphingomonadaceae bacterium]